MGKKHNDEEMAICPVGRFFMDLENASARRSKFFEHLDRSRVEFLKAIRSILDESIETLEKRERSGRQKKAAKIEVEE
ncbi:MAG: hypothetical protein JW836_07590 [Deltaproteobacteria bacterium]|nr:hypothetical protein [Deltaproteobacteria bacterium]